MVLSESFRFFGCLRLFAGTPFTYMLRAYGALGFSEYMLFKVVTSQKAPSVIDERLFGKTSVSRLVSRNAQKDAFQSFGEAHCSEIVAFVEAVRPD